ncbi:hypothetical protein HY419_00955 [candidate division WWE3 bacterium]|nr:hypothetical protein [candidate division WWE3 bacterium]
MRAELVILLVAAGAAVTVIIATIVLWRKGAERRAEDPILSYLFFHRPELDAFKALRDSRLLRGKRLSRQERPELTKVWVLVDIYRWHRARDPFPIIELGVGSVIAFSLTAMLSYSILSVFHSW